MSAMCSSSFATNSLASELPPRMVLRTMVLQRSCSSHNIKILRLLQLSRQNFKMQHPYFEFFVLRMTSKKQHSPCKGDARHFKKEPAGWRQREFSHVVMFRSSNFVSKTPKASLGISCYMRCSKTTINARSRQSFALIYFGT